MEILINGIVEDVNQYQGKNGYGCNIKISQLVDKRRKFLTLNTKDIDFAIFLESKLQEEVIILAELEQNNFGLRLTGINDVKEFDSETLKDIM